MLNTGRKVTRRACNTLRNVGLIILRNEQDPRRAFRAGGGRRGRGGNMFYSAEVYRVSISVCWGGLSLNGKRKVRIFMTKFRPWVNWAQYSMASGDAAILRYNNFFDWSRTADDIGDLVRPPANGNGGGVVVGANGNGANGNGNGGGANANGNNDNDNGNGNDGEGNDNDDGNGP